VQENRWRHIDAVLLEAEVRFALGQHADQLGRLEALADLVEAAADPRRQAAWEYWVGFLHCLTGSRPETAIGHCVRAAEIARGHGAQEIEDRAQSCLAQIYLFAGDLERALATGEHALRGFEMRGDLWWACRTLAHLSPTANAIGAWERSLAYCHRGLAHAEALDDRRLKIAWLGRLGSALVQRGDPVAGLARCEEALAMSPGPFDRAVVETVRGCALGRMGAHAEAVAVLKETHHWFERSGLAYTQCQVAEWLGEALLRAGDRAHARTVLEPTRSACERLGYAHLAAVAGRLLAEATAPSADTDDLIARSMAVFETIGARNEVARTRLARGFVLRDRGDVGSARVEIAAGLALFEQLGTWDEARLARETLVSLDEVPGAASAVAGGTAC
jgi:tetratricopeptide (TPR) repeat protein